MSSTLRVHLAHRRGVDVPRPTDASVHRPMPAIGVRPLNSSVPVDVVASSSGPAPHTRVDVVGQQRLGKPTSVNVARYPACRGQTERGSSACRG